MILGQKPSSAPLLAHAPRSFLLEVLPLLHDRSLTLNSHQRRYSSASGNGGRFCGSRRGFESGFEASKNDDDEDFEIDVLVNENARAMQC